MSLINKGKDFNSFNRLIYNFFARFIELSQIHLNSLSVTLFFSHIMLTWSLKVPCSLPPLCVSSSMKPSLIPESIDQYLCVLLLYHVYILYTLSTQYFTNSTQYFTMQLLVTYLFYQGDYGLLEAVFFFFFFLQSQLQPLCLGFGMYLSMDY